nr:MAG TPA: hypothetical protein [Caudoviricetes sp.]
MLLFSFTALIIHFSLLLKAIKTKNCWRKILLFADFFLILRRSIKVS